MILAVIFYKEYDAYIIMYMGVAVKVCSIQQFFGWKKLTWHSNLSFNIHSYLYVYCKFLIVVRRASFNRPIKIDQWPWEAWYWVSDIVGGREGPIEYHSFFGIKVDSFHHIFFLLTQSIQKTFWIQEWKLSYI